MQDEIEYEYNDFLKDIKVSGFISGKYMDETAYEDEYSHNDINKATGILQEKIIAYLHENRPGEFVVISDWCLHVLTLDMAKKLGVSEMTIEQRLVR